MTLIKRMAMRGFKSFAKRTEFVFENKFNCILGPNGSGKCVTGDTLVQLSDGSQIKIKDLIDKNIDKGVIEKLEDGVISYNNNAKILCLDTNTLKVVEKNVKAFVKRTSPKNLMKITTSSGKNITATKYHPLFVLKDGKIRSIKSEELKEGEKIAIPRNINIKPKNKIFHELLDEIKVKDKLYVPYDEKTFEKLKIKTWKKISNETKIPYLALKGYKDKQSINFTYLVKLLRYNQIKDNEIISLIPKVKGKTSSIKYKIPWENSPEFSRFLGYLIAEGRLTESNQIWFTNGQENIIKDYHSLIQTIFGLKATINEYKQNCWDVLAYSNPIITILKKFGMGETKNKSISNIFIKHSSNENFWQLINGLYSGDGYVSKNSIELVTKSPQLAQDVATIFLRLGIITNTKDIVKIATNSGFSGKYKQINIYGTNNFTKFKENFEFAHELKRNRINEWVPKKANPNKDLIEVNSLVKKISNDIGLNIKQLRKEYPKLDAYCYNQCTPSRAGVQQLLTLFKKKTKQKTKEMQMLELFVNSDIFWDEITSIEQIESNEEWVYDLCVEEHHNFIANNFFVHNSNVLDSLCFVLGRGSAKSMRAEKSSNLIYNGGKSKNPAKDGEVSIVFDNSEKIFPIEADEVKITRIIKRSGQSVYRINDQNSTRQGILDLLSHGNIDPDGYNIILQGDIVKFVEMSGVERRQTMEGISGIGVYEERKLKALRDLEKVDDKLNEAEIILTERNSYLKELKKERDQALKFKELKDKLGSNKATLLNIQITRKNSEKEKFDKEIGESKQTFETLEKEVNSLKQNLVDLRSKSEKISKEIEQKGEKEQVEIHKQVEQLKIDLATNNSRIDNLNNEIQRVNQRKLELKAELNAFKDRSNDLVQEKSRLDKLKIQREKDLNHVQNEIDKFRQKNKISDASDIDSEIDNLDKNAENNQKNINLIREKQQEFFRERDKIEYLIQNLDDKIAKVMEISKEHKSEIKNLQNMKERFKKATLDLNKSLTEDSSFAAKIGDARKRMNIASEKLHKLQAKQNSIHHYASADMALKKILELKNKINGIYGTVSELGKVSKKYSTALEIAAGNKIKNIVVENDKVASECIDYLKKNKLGVATFIPLNKIRSAIKRPEVESLVKKNRVHGMGLDLISFDRKFQDVFSYVFGNILVVDDINTARNIGIGKAKMVTLDGDLADISGSMKGGFRTKSRGLGFTEEEVVKDLSTTEAEVGELSSIMSSYERKRTDNESKIISLRKEKAELEGEIITKEKSLHLDSGDLDASKMKKNTLREDLKKVEDSINEVQSEISKINRELATNKIKKQELKTKVNQLRNPRIVAEMNAFDDKKTKLKEDIIHIEADLRNLNNQLEISNPESDKIQNILKQHDKELEKFQEEINKLNSKISEDKEDLKVKEKQSKEFYAKYKQLFNERNKLADEMNKASNNIERKSEESRKVEIKMNTQGLENARIIAELSGLEHEFKEFKDYELYTNKSESQLKSEVDKFERLASDMGAVNMKALEIYDKVELEYNSLIEKRNKLGEEKDDVLALIDEIEIKKKEKFLETFEVINNNFKDIFKNISTKGEAFLKLDNPENPFDDGVRVLVRLSGTKFMDIRSLSGGEKTMTALAFIFAIQEHDPHSFYVLDEVDAALDKRNAETLAKLIRQYVHRAQYVVISHNDAMISEADNLYGVSMNEHGMTNVTSIKL